MNKENILQDYSDCFDGIGKFQGPYHIAIDTTIPPVIHGQRKIPISLKEKIKSELDEMSAQGIITKVKEGELTAWVNSLVYKEKPNGRLRLCLDPKDLNKAIQREHHVTPTVEEILPKLAGAKMFSIVDAKCGYWNMELDAESSYLTTFNSPFGRYRFLRIPFGLRMSQDVFQARIDQTFEGCEGVIGIADDIIHVVHR
ncbi:retrovirus-related Pol polyprotein from transposon 297-like Protein [Elysia marginata]|uniref:Retrovirus-related Pol polyprotein from transposon 297-like Protein n=1 Tax=Elysia marginata TaxID=1093978 RepID=A0AAV4I5F3_9GAST|nr:retrovirus-related Pol polyprotein from transposon 297-like Protein [Elysia marginata]